MFLDMKAFFFSTFDGFAIFCFRRKLAYTSCS